MTFSRRQWLTGVGAALVVGCASNRRPVVSANMIIATYNTSLYGSRDGELIERLRSGDEAARSIAQVLRQVRPDIVLLNEFDYDPAGTAARLFSAYLMDPGLAGEPLHYGHRFTAAVNTGVPSGLDLDGDGRSEGPQDCWGYGLHPGQYGMLLLSRFPIDTGRVRSFRQFRWAAMPGARRPHWPDGRPYHSDAIWAQLRLSSKSHWDVPVQTPLGEVHVLASHPTPPVFDGPEDRNGQRNHDEIRLWTDYLTPGGGDYLIDDQGRRGGLTAGAHHVVLGDLNADPFDGDSREGIAGLLAVPSLQSDFLPRSAGGRLAAERDGGANARHRGDPAADTGAFGADPGPGNMRVDYVLPSRGLPIEDGGVYWPAPGQTGADWIEASDHRLVWVRVGQVT
ncbi:MAG: endonuclease/exonuclease/phosphatase family protein [Xanthomonadales bacterium]|nr:endonuclease/exonuclease/phosphatase family protein [Xanthomonadales bacterium]